MFNVQLFSILVALPGFFAGLLSFIHSASSSDLTAVLNIKFGKSFKHPVQFHSMLKLRARITNGVQFTYFIGNWMSRRKIYEQKSYIFFKK